MSIAALFGDRITLRFGWDVFQSGDENFERKWQCQTSTMLITAAAVSSSIKEATSR